MSEKLKFALFGNVYQVKKSAIVRDVLTTLAAHGADVAIEREYHAFLKDAGLLSGETRAFDVEQLDADFAVSMGGDGTFLKTANSVGNRQIPILGVNMGRLGFLADISPAEVDLCVRSLCAGHYTVESRSLIQVEADGVPIEDGCFALNDVAVLKRDTASMISIRTNINGQYLTTYQADGIIVSTPTGSTAYSLSNGGPIIVPGTKVFAITAVAPHSLNVRPIVLSDQSEITLDVESRSHNFLVAIDGRSVKFREGTKITLRRAPFDTKVVKRPDHRYFSTLREKMMWGMDTRN